MTDYTSSDILNFSVNQQPLQVGAAFDALMKDRAAAMIDAHAETYGQQVFNAPEDDEQLELDLPEDDVDDEDIEDLDVDLDDLDDADLDVDDDLEDLDDLDLDSDEDITDEDA